MKKARAVKNKKNISYYMNLNYKVEVLEDKDEGGYVVSCPELPGCISQGESISDAMRKLKEAKELWFESMIDRKREIFEPKNEEEYSGQFKLRLPKSLHKKLAEKSINEGISMNQYCLYLITNSLK